MATAGLELDVWQGDWGLPSIDHSCLAVMAYCKFSKAPVKVQKANNPWKSPTGDLPILRHDDGQEAQVTEILDYLRKQNWGTDFELNRKQSADIIAFTSMLEEKLVPALLHLWWVDSKVYTEMTRPWYIKQMPFPFCYYFPLRKHKECETRLFNANGAEQLNEGDMEAKIYQDAKECLNSLSQKLGEKEFFFGNTPSSLDAVVFGYLAPLLKAPFPSATLQNHLKSCPNLCQLCSKIMQSFFPQDPQEIEAERKRQEEDRAKQAEALEYPNRKRNIMMSGMVALSAMMGYAFLSGLVQVEMADQDGSKALHGRTRGEDRHIENLRGSFEYDEDEDEDEEEEEEENTKNKGHSRNHDNSSDNRENSNDSTDYTTEGDNDNQDRDENAN